MFIGCYSLEEASVDTVQDVFYEIALCHFGINIVSINIVQTFLDSTCVVEITDLVKSPVWLIVVAIILSDSIFDLYLSSIPMAMCFPPLEWLCFCT